MIEKIYFTSLIVLILVSFGCWVLMNEDEKHEDTWYKTGITAVMLGIIILVVGMIAFIWLN